LPPAAAYTEVNNSVYVYGIGDFTAKNPRSSALSHKLRQEIEKTIARFEPRLRNVSVQIETQVENERSLRFRIVGLLVVEPIMESVAFDTYFDVNKGVYVISK
jgi:type VI secretion system protein ImpF